MNKSDLSKNRNRKTAMIILLLLFVYNFSFAKQLYFIITVDVEGTYGSSPYESMIIGNIPGFSEQFGTPKIMEICDRFNMKATFFVDVYEYRLHGEQKMAEIVKYIHNQNHDVQLHTHPSHWFHPIKKPKLKQEMYSDSVIVASKIWMKEYDLADQINILKEGIAKLEQWTGERPTVHRAGTYAANYETLKALDEAGIIADASMFYKNKDCALNDPLLTKNKVVTYENIIEFPVTCFQKETRLKIGPLNLGSKNNISKLDIDNLNLYELKTGINTLNANQINPMILFLHSYSFLKWNEDFTKFQPDFADIEKFERLLAWIDSNPNWNVITMKDAALNYLDNEWIMNGSDDVPTVEINKSYLDLISQSFSIDAVRKSKLAFLVVLVHILVACLIIIGSFMIIRKSAKKIRSWENNS